jgi:hypothetical protein
MGQLGGHTVGSKPGWLWNRTRSMEKSPAARGSIDSFSHS